MPNLLPETPPPSADPLSDVLGSMRLTGSVLFRAAFSEPWSVTTPDCQQLAQVLPFRTEKIIPFHVVASGGCWVEVPGREPAWLDDGDAIVLPYGDGHRLGGRERLAASVLRRIGRWRVRPCANRWCCSRMTTPRCRWPKTHR